ncbi:hypothetical protein FQ192_28335 [Pseudomonas sp. ANT_J12]|nr:hypothetical protein FQ192_28335 [Pseudomonas sp. ANT_J12]
MPAKNDDAVRLIHRSVAFAGKPRSYRVFVSLVCGVSNLCAGTSQFVSGHRSSGHFVVNFGLFRFPTTPPEGLRSWLKSLLKATRFKSTANCHKPVPRRQPFPWLPAICRT